MSSNFFQYCFPWQDHYNFHASVWSIIFVRRLSLKSDNRYCSLRSQQLGYGFNRYSEEPRSAFLPLLSFFKHPFPPFITLGDSLFSVSDYYFNEKMCLLLERTVKGKWINLKDTLKLILIRQFYCKYDKLLSFYFVFLLKFSKNYTIIKANKSLILWEEAAIWVNVLSQSIVCMEVMDG